MEQDSVSYRVLYKVYKAVQANEAKYIQEHSGHISEGHCSAVDGLNPATTPSSERGAVTTAGRMTMDRRGIGLEAAR